MNGIKTYLAGGLGLLSSIGMVGTTNQPMIGVVGGFIALAIIFLRMAIQTTADGHKITAAEIQQDLSDAKDVLAEIKTAIDAQAPTAGPKTIPFTPQS